MHPNRPLRSFFITRELFLNELENLDFLPPADQATATGAAPAHEVFRTPELWLALSCPSCGGSFRANYYAVFKESRGPCSLCGAEHDVNGEEIRLLFTNWLRQEIGRSDDEEPALKRLGRIIAKAAILLDPLCPVFVIGFHGARLGHYVVNTMNFLVKLKVAVKGAPVLIAFPPPLERTSNAALTELWRRSGYFIFTRAALAAYDLLAALRGHCLDNPSINLPTTFWQYEPDSQADGRSVSTRLVKTQPKPRHARRLIDLREGYWRTNNYGWDEIEQGLPPNFTAEEDARCRRSMEEIGLQEPFVAFMARDTAYLRHFDPKTDWTVYDFRNTDIKKCLPAMGWLAESGVGSVRLGAIVEEKLPEGLAGTVDYASRRPTELMDVYLPSKCLFEVSADSGQAMLPYAFKRPVLLVNVPSITRNCLYFNDPNLYCMFKKVWSRAEERFLSFKELFERGFDSLRSYDAYEGRGLDLVENTAEEILAGVREMYSRVVCRDWQVTEQEREARNKLLALVAEYYPDFRFRASLIHSFLKDNPFLLAETRANDPAGRP